MDGAAERIPTHLWVEAEIRRLSSMGISLYVLARGDKMSGIVLQKISNRAGACQMLIQQRNVEGRLIWVEALNAPVVDEREADAYIQRSIQRDPDMWVIEIEDPSFTHCLQNP
jgi:hypothetical protein